MEMFFTLGFICGVCVCCLLLGRPTHEDVARLTREKSELEEENKHLKNRKLTVIK